ncbi:helix-turn-helix domain-containing protein [Halieaceae bacterium IMCC14734]|uniref:Helix-turn-helix domain-containing protein n=1 Tax=Candidatus Litorirhabdus singularis TaxID=2518993 RepID=A0ABT3TK27_9GAMM|nr:helix-turn-helix domain-containing protein [Candidatus Litorirhabdus singularis]MCX2981722.1 helix-turn-helix domain-containing protein [Candidatus Litorirhabdus singularis]
MKRVIAAVYPRSLASSLTLPMDVLRAASQIAQASQQPGSTLEVMLAGTELAPIATAGGLELTPQLTLAQVNSCDMLLLPALWRNPAPVLKSQAAWIPKLRELAASGTVICSVGTASCFLAEAGLLDHKAATTHWNYFAEFERRYPNVNLKKHHLITQSENLYCAGSINSITDLMIHMVEGWYGTRVARAVESQFSPEIRRPFRAHAFLSGDASIHQDELVVEAQQWLQDNLHQRVNIADMLPLLQVSSRTLQRRFRQATGQTPLQYLNRKRLEAATDMLRASNLNVSEIAWQLGWQDVSYFTRLFRQHTGMTPARYRQSVRGKLFGTHD